MRPAVADGSRLNFLVDRSVFATSKHSAFLFGCKLAITMYLRQAGLTRNPTFSYLYCVRCRGQRVASEAPLERKYSRYGPFAKRLRGE